MIDLKAGDIVFVSPKGFWGVIVVFTQNLFRRIKCFLTKKEEYIPYLKSHGLVMLTDKLAFEATGLKTRISPFEQIYGQCKHITVYRLRDRNNIHWKLWDDDGLLGLFDSTYGFFQIPGMIVPMIGDLFGKKWKNPLRGGLVCTELIFEYLKYLGILGIDIDEYDKDSLNVEKMEYIIEHLNDKLKKVEEVL